MNRLHRTLAATVLLAGLGIGAGAQVQPQPAPAPPTAPRMMQGERAGMAEPGRLQRWREERMARRLADLKQLLRITPQQEGAWSTWTTALKPVAVQRPDRFEFARMTTPERIDRLKLVRAERHAQGDRRLDATKAFYAALDAEQKRLFDARGLRFLRNKGERGRPHGRHPMHG